MWYDLVNQWVPAMKAIITWYVNTFFSMLPQQLPPESVGRALSIFIVFWWVLWLIGLFLFWKDNSDDE